MFPGIAEIPWKTVCPGYGLESVHRTCPLDHRQHDRHTSQVGTET